MSDKRIPIDSLPEGMPLVCAMRTWCGLVFRFGFDDRLQYRSYVPSLTTNYADIRCPYDLGGDYEGKRIVSIGVERGEWVLGFD